MGVGTIVGSAVFNILCIIGVCGLFAGQVRLPAESGMGLEGGWHRGEAGFCLAGAPSAWGPVVLGNSNVGSHAWRLAKLELESVRPHYLVSMLMEHMNN